MDIKLLAVGAQIGLTCFFLGYLGWQFANYRFFLRLKEVERVHLELRRELERGQNDK